MHVSKLRRMATISFTNLHTAMPAAAAMTAKAPVASKLPLPPRTPKPPGWPPMPPLAAMPTTAANTATAMLHSIIIAKAPKAEVLQKTYTYFTSKARLL